MPKVTVDAHGNIVLNRTKEEIISYYNVEMQKRLAALSKLEALGADTTAVKNKIQQLNAEKKMKLIEVTE
jgi:hypothetical protein